MSDYYIWSSVFSLFLAACWVAALFGLPGSWAMIAGIIAFAVAFPASQGPGIGWYAIGFSIGFLLLGELVEFLAGAAGLAKGGSKRAALLATLGSLLGGMFGFGLGGPLGILFFSAVGALSGAVVGELWKGRSQQESWEFGKIAFWGRLMGSVAKAVFGGLAVGILMVSVWRHAVLW